MIALFAVSTKLAGTPTTKSKNEQKHGRAAMTEARDGKNIRKYTLFEVLTPVLSIFSIMLPYVAETGKMSLFA